MTLIYYACSTGCVFKVPSLSADGLLQRICVTSDGGGTHKTKVVQNLSLVQYWDSLSFNLTTTLHSPLHREISSPARPPRDIYNGMFYNGNEASKQAIHQKSEFSRAKCGFTTKY